MSLSLTQQFEAIPEWLRQRHLESYRPIMQTGHIRYGKNDLRGRCRQSATGRDGDLVFRGVNRSLPRILLESKVYSVYPSEFAPLNSLPF
jgi:hypothetical protein